MNETKEESQKKEQDTEPQLLGGWTEIKRRQLRLSLTHLFQPNSEETKSIFSRLEDEVEYLTGQLTRIRVFGKWCEVPRKQAGYGDPDVEYGFSGLSLKAKAWTPILKELRDKVASASKCNFNFVLVNRYKDGLDRAGEHRDDEKELNPQAPIASLTFGAERDFYFRHRDHRKGDKSEPLVTLSLADGTLLLMKPPTNTYWYHALPVRKKCKQVRINLTFRQILVKKASTK